jgi:hypothetical protein
MMIVARDLEVSVTTSWIISIELTHKPTGLVGYGQDPTNSRRAYALARIDLDDKLHRMQSETCVDAGLLRTG